MAVARSRNLVEIPSRYCYRQSLKIRISTEAVMLQSMDRWIALSE